MNKLWPPVANLCRRREEEKRQRGEEEKGRRKGTRM